MTTASKRSLHPEVIKRIGRLEIRARHIVEGLLSGMHRSPYFGQSVEFLQHREYTAGDDLRRVDWKVWAKQDRLYVKQYEEDTNLRCCLLVDTSASQVGKYRHEQLTAVSALLANLTPQDRVQFLHKGLVIGDVRQNLERDDNVERSGSKL